ncbi:MAG: S8 family serine peptidase [Chitinophagaceae bacterium]
MTKKSRQYTQKVDPKLRMYNSCDQEVNATRCGQNSNLTMSDDIQLKKSFEVRDPFVQQNPAEMKKMEASLKKKPMSKASSQVYSNVFIELCAADAKVPDLDSFIQNGNLVSAKVALTKLAEIAADDNVLGVEIPRTLKLTDPVVIKEYATETPSADLNLKGIYKAGKVLIGIIDVGGFDFAHPEFIRNNKTRFVSIWDQGSTLHDAPKGFDYGAEFTADMLNKALEASKKTGIPATQLEKQSVMTLGSHATHVASIAAGKNGVCPHADIIGVSIALQKGDHDPRKSFYDSSCIVKALEYIIAIADDKKLPVSINISLGTNGHAHDGSDATSRWINSRLSVAGRCVCVASGNAGQERPLREGDYGFTMGRIHTSGRIASTGLTRDVFWTVVGNGVADLSENELEFWYAPQDRISVQIKPPGGDWIGPVRPNEFIQNQQLLPDGSYLSVYNVLYHFANGANYIAIYLIPGYKNGQITSPIRAGNWQVRLIGEEIRDGEFHGWIERDDPRRIGPMGNREGWNFPSYLSEESNVDNSSINSLACANYVIAVGNCDKRQEKIHISSSQGPTRDKRFKPEIIAPGTDIVAAKGFAGPDDLYISMTGTSMASPHVCGVAARMLGLDKKLTAAQIQGIMIRTSKPLPGGEYKWRDDTGFGLIDPEKCLEEAKLMRDKKDITK